MQRLRKCKNRKLNCTILYFGVLSLAFIVSSVLTIWRNDLARRIAFQLPSLNYASRIRNTERVKTDEFNEQIEEEQQTAVTESNFRFSAQVQSPVGKVKSNNINDNKISTPGIGDRTKVSKSLLHKHFLNVRRRNHSSSPDLKNKRTESSSKEYWKSDGDKYRPDLKDYNIYDDNNTHDKTEHNDVILPEGILNNTSQVIINKDWVVALRARTSKMGILRKSNLHWTIAKAGKYSSHLFTPPFGEIPRQRLPQAIIIGVGHCCTRALINFLTMHPYIVSSEIEIHFFDRDENFSKGYSWYKAQMPLSYSNQITMEKTPCYVYNERALNEIYKMNRKTKLIVILKDPVARFISMLFTIHVLEGSEFIKDPAKEINKLESFLEVPHFITKENFYFNISKGFYCLRPLHTNKVSCLGGHKGRHHPSLDAFVERKLCEYYRDHNEKLFQLLGRRYSWEPDYISNSVLQRNSSHRGHK